MKRPELKEHQVRAVSYAHKNPYSILALDPGLGKSRCAIEVRDKLNLNCLVICPSYLIHNWGNEIAKWGKEGVQTTLFTKGKQIYEVCDTDYVVTSYDLVQKAEHLFEWADMVVLDEAHAIKSMKAKRTQFLHKTIYENSVPRVHLLTGTPIKNRVQEFYSLLALCYYNPSAADGQFLETYPSEIDFADHFSTRSEYTMEISGKWVTVVKWDGIRNTTELKQWLENKYIRVYSSDVLDLPEVSYKDFHISNDDDENLIAAFRSYFTDEDDLDEKHSLERDERTGSVLPEHKAAAALKKVPFTIKYATDLMEEVKPILIYSDHVKSAEEIAKHFGVEAITGKMPSTRRSQMADAFQRGEGDLLVCTVGAMKEGKDLFRASHIIFNDYPWVPGDLKQVIYRIQRIGQKSNCTVHRVVGSPQDYYIMEVINEKLKTIEEAT